MRTDLADAKAGRFKIVEGTARTFQKSPAQAGEFDFARGAIEQAHPKRGFQAFDAS